METGTEIEVESGRGNYPATLLPERYEVGHTCRKCNQKIRFARTISGKTIPVSQYSDSLWQMHLVVCEKGGNLSPKP